MNTLKPSRFLKRLTVGSLVALSLSHVAFADDVNLKPMIPGVPDIAAESLELVRGMGRALRARGLVNVAQIFQRSGTRKDGLRQLHRSGAGGPRRP